MMPRLMLAALATLVALTVGPAPAGAADDAKVKAATKQVERGAQKLGKGVEEAAKGIGNTVVESSKFTGEKIKESGKAAQPEAKSAWASLKQSATRFGYSVKSFFTKLFGD